MQIFFFFWPPCVAWSILVSPPGLEPVPLAVKKQSPNHWTTREVPIFTVFYVCYFNQDLWWLESPPAFTHYSDLFECSFSKYFLSIHCVPSTKLSAYTFYK